MEKDEIQNELAYSLTERPRCFMVSDRPFFIYPATLGMIHVCRPLIQALSHDEELGAASSTLEILRICEEDRRKVAELLAYRTCRGKDEVSDTPAVAERTEFLAGHMEMEDMANVLVYILNEMACDVEEYEKATGIASERMWMRKAINAKDREKGSLTFGGRTVYGSLIGHFCKEYGWSFQYVVWGISFVNLKMLMDDEVTTVYLSEDERRKCGVPQDRSGVDMSYKEFAEKYKNAFDR